ncbi:MAG: InlB B-repeat-containing protein, partial [Clostridiales bacterium]|nr:InlB B-repeat-containing protein [Clostridiales bacterium]
QTPTPEPIQEHTVTFVDGLTGETINTQIVVAGEDAVAPEAPVHEGYTFVEWDTDFTNVQSDLTVTAVYEIIKYNVHIATTACGTASPIGDIQVEHGVDLTINMTPDANHYVWYVTINGEIVAVRPGNVITINDITEDLDIFIVFNTDAPEVTPPTPAPTPSVPPKTGAISMTAIAIMAIASGAGIVLFRKK